MELSIKNKKNHDKNDTNDKKKIDKSAKNEINHSILSYIIDNFRNTHIDMFNSIKCHNNKHIIHNNRIKHIIVIGDIHGDYNCLLECLKLADIIDKSITYHHKIDDIEWHTRKNIVLVQIGDIIDMKCRFNKTNGDSIDVEKGDNIRIFKLLYKLQVLAPKNNSKIICLLGNHEIDNVIGNFKYTSRNEFMEFYKQYGKEYKNENDTILGYTARKTLFSRGNIIAKHLAYNFMSNVVINNWLFIHAGIHMDIIKKYTLQDMNSIFKKWLLSDETHKDYNNDIDILYNSKYSILRDRTLCNLKDTTKNLQYFMSLLKEINKKNKTDIKGIIIGHTPQINDGINSVFDNKLWKVDTGMSFAFNGNSKRIHILEIDDKNDTYKVI